MHFQTPVQRGFAAVLMLCPLLPIGQLYGQLNLGSVIKNRMATVTSVGLEEEAQLLQWKLKKGDVFSVIVKSHHDHLADGEQ